MNEDFYISLLYRKLSGEIEQEDLEMLEQWLSASEENKKTAQTIETVWESTATINTNLIPNIDLDKEFNALESRIQQTEKQQGTKAPKVRRLNPSWYAVAASLVLLLTVGYLFRSTLFGTTQQEWVEVTTEDTIQDIQLADGTVVKLNKNSYLKYPKTFGDSERNVFMKGEAFYQVKHDATKPFLITSDQVKVKVLGTSFNVEDWKTKKQAVVSVTSGKVLMQTKNQDKEVILEKGDQGIYNPQDQTLVQSSTNAENSISWFTKKLVFANTPLTTVIQTLEKTYAITIEIENQELISCGFTSQVQTNNPKEALETLALVFGMELEEVEPKYFRLTGGHCE